MAKRKEDAPKKGSPAWMSTFSDLMNLLLCFFILLFASSTVDQEKLEQVAASFSQQNYSVLPQGATAIGDGKMISNGMSQLTMLDNYVNRLGKNKDGDAEKDNTESEQAPSNTTQSDQQSSTQVQEVTTASLQEQVQQEGLAQSKQMAEEISSEAENYKIADKIDIDYDAQFVQISLSGGILFESGDAQLTKDAKKLVKKIGLILEQYRKRTIEIEGHTDNVPSSGSKFPDNQYLSAARAITVYEFLLDNNNLIAKNMKHSGYGDSKPRVSNKTESGRAKNRRVEIKIYNQISSEN